MAQWQNGSLRHTTVMSSGARPRLRIEVVEPRLEDHAGIGAAVAHRVEDQEVVDPAHPVGGGAGLDLGVDAVGLEVEALGAELVGGDEAQLAGGRDPHRDRAAPQVVHGP